MLKIIARYKYLFLAIMVFTLFCSFKLDLRFVTDEAWISAQALNLATTGKIANPLFINDKAGRDKICISSPNQTVLLAGSFRLFGFGIVQGRTLSIVFGLIAIIFTYLLAQYLFGQQVAIFSSLLVATDNFFFLAARTIRAEIIVTTFLLIAFFTLLRGIEKHSMWILFISGISAGFGLLSHLNFIISTLALIFIILTWTKDRILLRKYLQYFVGGIALVIMPYLVYLIIILFPDKYHFIAKQYLFNSRVYPLFSLQWLLLSLKREIFIRWADFVYFPYRFHIFIAIFCSVIFSFIKKEDKSRQLFFIIIFHILAFWLIIINKNVRYLTIIIPYFWILTAHVGFQLFRGDNKQKLGTILLVFFIASQMAGTVIFFHQYKDSGYGHFINQLRSIIPDKLTVYGPITFWPGLRDHEYFTYDGLSFKEAKDRYGAEIYIYSPRELEHPGPDEQEWGKMKVVREAYSKYFANRRKLLGEINNRFYGRVKIYKDGN